jgi:MFS family permease
MATPPVATRAVARFGPRAVAITGLLIDVAALIWLSRWGAHGSVFAEMVAPALVFGLGGSMSFFAMTVLMTSEIAHEHSGLGSGLFNAGRQVGGSIGLAALTVVAAAHTRSLLSAHHGPVGQATASGYGLAFIVSAGLDLVGIAILAVPFVNRRARRGAVDSQPDPDCRRVEVAPR